MNTLKALVLVLLLGLSIYTGFVVLHQGVDFLSVAWRDLQAVGWSGQFIVDFSCYLVLSALWVCDAAVLHMGHWSGMSNALFWIRHWMQASSSEKHLCMPEHLGIPFLLRRIGAAAGPGGAAAALLGGDHTTLDVSAYGWGQAFDTWLIPAMRLIVDFGQSEPMIGVNSSGQSGNPASPHYADGIDAWLKGRYVSFPFQPQNLDRVYGNKRLTLTPAR